MKVKCIYILINGYGYIEEQKQKIISMFFFCIHYLLLTKNTNGKMESMNMLENYLDRLSLLETLGISQSTLSRRIKYDNFPYIKMKGRIYFNKEEVENYLLNHSHNHQLNSVV